jgi:hypothetical protein
MKNETCTQLELGMSNHLRATSVRQVRRQRINRAEWWFRKMRQVVNLALPPQPMVAPPAEQTYLRLRQTSML